MKNIFAHAALLEIKVTTGNTKSVKVITNHPEKYHVGDAIKPGDYNTGRTNNIMTLSFYMAFLLTAYCLFMRLMLW